MNDKEKQMEEMYQDFLNYKEATLCKVFSYKGMCENFIDLGYTKIAYKNSVVLTKEELKKIIQEEYQNALKDKVVLTKEEYKQLLDNAIRVDMEYLDHELAQARKETAREIFQWLKEHTFDSSFAIIETYFKEQHEVDVDNV